MSFRNRKRKNFTQVGNEMLYDPRLKNSDKGLLTVMLSFRDDWIYYIDHLVKLSDDGRDAIRAQISRLEAAGYIRRERARNEDGTLGDMIYEVSDEPIVTLSSNGFSNVGFPYVGFPDANNTDLNNTQNNNTQPPAEEEEQGENKPGKEEGSIPDSSTSSSWQKDQTQLPDFQPNSRSKANPPQFRAAPPFSQPDSSTKDPEIAGVAPRSTPQAAEPSRAQPEPARGILDEMAARRSERLKETRKGYARKGGIEEQVSRDLQSLLPGNFTIAKRLMRDTGLKPDKLLTRLRERPRYVTALEGLDPATYERILTAAQQHAHGHTDGWQAYVYAQFFDLLSKENMSGGHSYLTPSLSSTKEPGWGDPLPDRRGTTPIGEFNARINTVTRREDAVLLIQGYMDRREVSFGNRTAEEIAERYSGRWEKERKGE